MIHPLVSVIIPNFNHAPYLDQRVRSVLNQTYPEFEIIILDDKSSDNSVEIINKYQANPHVVHVEVNKENSGSTFVQWNRGMELAKGDIIWIAESDDYCEPYFLESLVSEYVKDSRNVIVYCTSEYVDANNNDLGTYNHYSKSVYHMDGRDFIKERNSFGCAIWNASSAIFSKPVALSISKHYQTYKMCGDKLFWILMAEKGNVVHVNKIMNYFRQHQNKVSPRRFRDGTWLREEYEIFQYQCKKGYISGSRKYFVMSLYKNKIETGDFDSSDVEFSLKKLWGFDSGVKNAVLDVYSRLYQYCHLYILHKSVI